MNFLCLSHQPLGDPGFGGRAVVQAGIVWAAGWAWGGGWVGRQPGGQVNFQLSGSIWGFPYYSHQDKWDPQGKDNPDQTFLGEGVSQV